MSWEKCIVESDKTLGDVIYTLNATGLKIVLLVDKSSKFIGSITDGDIRRGLLRGLTLQDSVMPIVNLNPVISTPNEDVASVKNKMLSGKIYQIPVIKDGYVINLHQWDSLFDPVILKNVMVVMAGGLGTRLMPHTKNCPKPMLQVAGKPILEHILEGALKSGFRRFIISVNYLGEMIEDYFGSGVKWGAEITYLRELSQLGTAGSLSLINEIIDEPFLVCNGDVLSDIQYREMLNFHRVNKADATMAVTQYEWQNPYGVVKTNGIDIIGLEEKPVMRSHVNAGVYILEPHTLGLLPKNTYCDMPTLFEEIRNRRLRNIAYAIHEPWLDIGRSSDLDVAKLMKN